MLTRCVEIPPLFAIRLEINLIIIKIVPLSLFHNTQTNSSVWKSQLSTPEFFYLFNIACVCVVLGGYGEIPSVLFQTQVLRWNQIYHYSWFCLLFQDNWFSLHNLRFHQMGVRLISFFTNMFIFKYQAFSNKLQTVSPSHCHIGFCDKTQYDSETVTLSRQ